MSTVKTESTVIFSERPELDRPIVIEGLPGVGNVGKIVADFLADKLGAKHMATLTSRYLPPQVLVDADSIAVMPSNEIFYAKDVGESHLDVLFLLGDFQATSAEGQVVICDDLMRKVFLPYDVSTVFTLGGYGTGQLVENPRILGTASSQSMKERLEPYGLTFSPNEPAAGIVGASGILIGLCQQYEVDAACIMGETSGFYIDYRIAIKVLEIVQNLLGTQFDTADLEEKGKQVDEINNKMKMYAESQKRGDNLGYIG